MPENLCKEFENPFHKLLACTRDVQILCGPEGVSLPQVRGIAMSRDIDSEELLEHLKLLGYKVEGEKVICPSE